MPKTDANTDRFVPTADHLRDLVARDQPAAVNAERGLLSCLMQRPDLYPAVAEILTPDSFYHAGYAALYGSLSSIIDRGGHPDPPALEAELSQRGVLQGLGGIEGVLEVWDTEASPCAEVAAERAHAIAECAARRRMADVGARMIANAHSTKHTLPKLVDFAGRDVLELSALVEGRGGATGMSTAADAVPAMMKALTDPEARPTGIPTGYPDLDALIVGLVPGSLTIVGARPSQGKTALLLNIARMVADQGTPGGVFSMEMSRGELLERLLSAEAGVPGDDIRHRRTSHFDRESLDVAGRTLSSYPLVIDDTPALTLMQLRNRARRMVLDHGAKWLGVDYLQLMTDPGNNSRQEEVSALSRGIKALARELSVPILCLSQLNRSAEGRQGHRPKMSDLRESGSIEQDADVIWLLHREDYYHQGEADYTPNNVAEVIIAKQRNGPTGVVRMDWRGDIGRFSSRAYSGQEDAAQESGLYDAVEV